MLNRLLHEFLPDVMELTAREARGELSDEERVDLAAVRAAVFEGATNVYGYSIGSAPPWPSARRPGRRRSPV